jgi:molybdate transport system regulatory protein
MKEHRPTIRIHLWLEQEGSVFFGKGRVLLLDKIEELGSIKKAAEALGMSYRAAWGKIKATEKVLGMALVESHEHKRNGCRLSQQGKMLRDHFSLWFDKVEHAALTEAEKIFPWPVKGFVDSDTENHP